MIHPALIHQPVAMITNANSLYSILTNYILNCLTFSQFLNQ